MTYQMMIDIETLSLKPNAVITEIGYGIFDENFNIVKTKEPSDA